jgi:hypothetical protein
MINIRQQQQQRSATWRNYGSQLERVLANGIRMPKSGVHYIHSQSVTHTLNVKTAATPQQPISEITSALRLQLIPKLCLASSSSELGIDTAGSVWWVNLGADCPNYGELSGLLNNGGALPVSMPDGSIVSVPVTHRYSYVPKTAMQLLFCDLPPSLNFTGTAAAFLEMAGYAVQIPDGSASSHPSRPPPDNVTILSVRNGKTNQGDSNSSIIIVTVILQTTTPTSGFSLLV